jgi:amidase
MDPLFGASLVKLLDDKRNLMCDYNVAMAEESLQRATDPLAFYRATCRESVMYAAFAELMETCDAFVCPTVTTNRIPADFNPATDDYIVNGKQQQYDLGISTCHIFNMMGRCPAISVPSGIGDNGVPTGLQIASRAYDDVSVFKVASILESDLGGWPAPGVNG